MSCEILSLLDVLYEVSPKNAEGVQIGMGYQESHI